MITADVTRAVAELTAKLGTVTREHVPYAAARALTFTAEGIQVQEIREMRDVFSQPTPWTLGSTYVKPATKATLEATVGLKNFAGKGIPATKFLSAQIAGGERHMKRFERAMRAVAHLPMEYRIVPGSGADLDAYGNIKPSQIVQILSYFRANESTLGYRGNMGDKRRAALAKGTKSKQGFEYFIGRAGGRGSLAVYKRLRFAGGTAIKPVMVFVRGAQYEPIYDFEYVARLNAERLFLPTFSNSLAEAMRTAR